ncbi:FAD binding domain-containing protein [Colletotrichum truncatum]|uniref:FAD binding domain-containing protein n=1 Tax=Colletotrichum truncatum TaxID=5467 RepID=A0ACC3ZHJ9_COLTU|nr:FAD binding domain-containing protein [Colletotrichum truncatum]KAF6782295.1 FAD binding domain-containing protein [Colletotrichum truncatum]
MTSSPFKVIIIGGGPSGITAAHALHHAGIDFVVLERRTNIVEDLGASLVLGPPSMRVFHQLGILDKLMEIGCLLNDNKGFTSDGYNFKESSAFKLLQEHHGSVPLAFHRAHLIQALYDTLPDDAKARYFTGKKLANIASTDKGVAVTCEDGSTYTGSIVLGADGVHSATRRQMRRLALEEDPSRDWDPEKPYETNYRCMWASFPRPTAAGQSYETQGTDKSVMYITGKERGWIFCYEKLAEPTKERISFTEKELEEYGDRFAEWPVTGTLKVRDVFKERYNAGGAGLEEGICTQWSWGGKIVLVGDAAHKFTPNAGLGFNNGVQDVVALCNGLRKMVSETGGSPSYETLDSFFQEYRTERLELLEKDLGQSARLTRLHAWASTFDWFMARYILSWSFIQKMLLTYIVSPAIQKARVLDFITTSEPFEPGSFQWLHPLLNNMSKNRAL